MHPVLNIALRATRTASEHLIRSFERLDIIKLEPQRVNEFLEQTGLECERNVAAHIQKAYPDHGFCGRYSGELSQTTAPEFHWHFQPLDGENNARNGLPVYCVALWCISRGKTIYSVIINPVTGEEYTAAKGSGAQLNGKRIRVSNRKTIDGSLVSTATPESAESRLPFTRQLGALIDAGARYRISGSTLLDLANLAAGRIDACHFYGLKPEQRDAGLVLIQEAGGLITDLKGGSGTDPDEHMVATNPKLVRLVIKSLSQARG